MQSTLQKCLPYPDRHHLQRLLHLKLLKLAAAMTTRPVLNVAVLCRPAHEETDNSSGSPPVCARCPSLQRNSRLRLQSSKPWRSSWTMSSHAGFLPNSSIIIGSSCILGQWTNSVDARDPARYLLILRVGGWLMDAKMQSFLYSKTFFNLSRRSK